MAYVHKQRLKIGEFVILKKKNAPTLIAPAAHLAYWHYICHNQAMQKVLLFILITTALNAQPPGADSTKWKLTFADEFNGSRVNKTIWRTGFGAGQHPNSLVPVCNYGQPNQIDEPPAYVDFKNDTNNVKVSNGTVKIYTRKENMTGEFWDWDTGNFRATQKEVNFTTGVLYSNNKYYRGYYELRFKLPAAPKFPMTYAPFGANFWLYDGGCWHEIDGFEFINGQDRTITSNVHYVLPPTMIGADTVCENTFTTPKHYSDYKRYTSVSDNEWHTFGFNWEENSIAFYLDGVNFFTSTMPYISSLKPMNIILNVNAPLSNTCVGLNGLFTKFPYVYEIDYLRIWQKKED